MTACLDCVKRLHGPIPTEWVSMVEALCVIYMGSCEGAAAGLERHLAFAKLLDELRVVLGDLSPEQRASAFKLFKARKGAGEILSRWATSPPEPSKRRTPPAPQSDQASALAAADPRQADLWSAWGPWHGQAVEMLAAIPDSSSGQKTKALRAFFVAAKAGAIPAAVGAGKPAKASSAAKSGSKRSGGR